jgi:excisionase family DNA binding protein
MKMSNSDDKKRTTAPGFFTIEEVSVYLGISQRSVRRAIEEKRLVAHSFGRAVRIRDKDVEGFVAAHCNNCK